MVLKICQQVNYTHSMSFCMVFIKIAIWGKNRRKYHNYDTFSYLLQFLPNHPETRWVPSSWYYKCKNKVLCRLFKNYSIFAPVCCKNGHFPTLIRNLPHNRFKMVQFLIYGESAIIFCKFHRKFWIIWTWAKLGANSKFSHIYSQICPLDSKLSR
jgi:hypothetical protein